MIEKAIVVTTVYRVRYLPGLHATATALCAAVSLLGLTGCNTGPAAIPPVDVDIDRVVNQLFVDFDSDKNGGLSEDELAASPPLAQCLSNCRRDRGQEISAQQLKKNLEVVFDRRSSLVSASCVVRRNGQPLVGAEVRFVPLPVLQGILPIATGVTDSEGTAMVAPPREELPREAPNVAGLMPPGLYLVEITHPTMKIPEKYNQKTVLGKEVSSETVYRGGLAVNLKL
ncbi:MAG: hypothetical protein WD738_04935 [Pirellulales bacterium]